MPCAGTRVRRGRHWNYENQDDYGVGTVIGHSEEGVFAFFSFHKYQINNFLIRSCSSKAFVEITSVS